MNLISPLSITLMITLQACSVIAQQKPIDTLNALSSFINQSETGAHPDEVKTGGTKWVDESFEGRKYILYTPEGHEANRPTPLVLTMHGSGGTIEKFYNLRNPELMAQADQRGWILVFPEGTPCEGKEGFCYVAKDTHLPNPVDDVGYMRRLIEHLGASLTLDPDSIYAMGFSNGGGMAERLGAELPELFAAVASVGSATTGYDGANEISKTTPLPRAPISVLLVRGLQDKKRNYEGFGPQADGTWIGSARDDAKFWSGANGCDLSKQRRRQKREKVSIEGYDQCNAGTETLLISVQSLPHEWPDRADGYGFDANKRILQFFARHSLASRMQ